MTSGSDDAEPDPGRSTEPNGEAPEDELASSLQHILDQRSPQQDEPKGTRGLEVEPELLEPDAEGSPPSFEDLCVDPDGCR